MKQYLVGAYETRVSETEKRKLMVPIPLDESLKSKVCSHKRQWGASWCEQYSILFCRGIKERRHDYFSWLRITQVLSTAVILGLLWWQSDANNPKGLQDQVNKHTHESSYLTAQENEKYHSCSSLKPQLPFSTFTGWITFLHSSILGILSSVHSNIHISSREGDVSKGESS